MLRRSNFGVWIKISAQSDEWFKCYEFLKTTDSYTWKNFDNFGKCAISINMELTQLDSWTHLWYKKNAAAHSLLSFWASLHSFRAVPYSLKNNPRQASKIVRRLQLNYEVDIKESYKISIFSSRKIFLSFFFLKVCIYPPFSFFK